MSFCYHPSNRSKETSWQSSSARLRETSPGVSVSAFADPQATPKRTADTSKLGFVLSVVSWDETVR